MFDQITGWIRTLVVSPACVNCSCLRLQTPISFWINLDQFIFILYMQEISLCRVYKRPGIEDNFHLTTNTRSSGSKAAASMEKKHHRTSASPRLAPMFDGGHSSSAHMNKPYSGTI